MKVETAPVLWERCGVVRRGPAWLGWLAKGYLHISLGCVAICDDVRVEGGVVIPVAAIPADAIFAGGMDI